MSRNWFLRAALALGFAFLYVPIALLVATSFNPSRLTTAFSGFSLRWYQALLANDRLIEAALLSLQIAALSATGATVLGTAAGYALARFGRFRGRGVFAGLLSARLVLPDVLVGLSLLLLFVQLEQWTGWPPGRGALTITLAHISVALAYVAVVIEATHACMAARGVRTPGVTMVTSRMMGVFREDERSRKEVLSLMGARA